MTILAIEFSSTRRSVTVLDQPTVPNEPRVVQVVAETQRETRSAAMVRDVLAMAHLAPRQISKLAVGLGPGSYAGIRHALAFLQGWQLAFPIPLVGVASSKIIAWQLQASGQRGSIGVIIDALRQEYCMETYELSENEVSLTAPLHLVSHQTLSDQCASGLPVAGPVPADQSPPGAMVMFPDATTLAERALHEEGTSQAETMAPIYLRKATFVMAPPPRTWDTTKGNSSGSV